MATVLTFALAAPLGGMGGVAVGERRTGWDRPGRSAVLGLVAACLGLERSDEVAQAELAAGFGMALRREGSATALLTDYHTAQTPPAQRKRQFLTRRDELSVEPETVLTWRDYRADIAFAICLWSRGASARWTLDEVAAGMREPAFVPYLGRRSCPLGLPLAPMVLEADSVADALRARDAVATSLERAILGCGRGAGTVWADESSDGPPLGLSIHRVETRRDEPLSRRRWQFGLRDEVAATWPGAAA